MSSLVLTSNRILGWGVDPRSLCQLVQYLFGSDGWNIKPPFFWETKTLVYFDLLKVVGKTQIEIKLRFKNGDST